MMDYDSIEEYIQLLKSEQELMKQNKSLITEDKDKYCKLLNYAAKTNDHLNLKYVSRIEDHLHWSNRNQYLQLIQDFLNFKIDGKNFSDQLNLTFRDSMESWPSDSTALRNIEFKPDSIHFETWISDMQFCCIQFSDSIKTEAQLRDVVRELMNRKEDY